MIVTNIPYKPATFKGRSFNCVHCGAYAKQEWGKPLMRVESGQSALNLGVFQSYWTCRCSHCEKFSFWVEETLVYPWTSTAPPPNPDLPPDISADFDEARDILSKSPRGAAALLRLCIQKLCKELGEDGRNINDDIGALVKKGLSPQIQKALDVVRVVGNNAVHPGQIDLADDIGTAQKLFGLVNIIADAMISQPKHVNELFETIVPDAQKTAIAKRDA